MGMGGSISANEDGTVVYTVVRQSAGCSESATASLTRLAHGGNPSTARRMRVSARHPQRAAVCSIAFAVVIATVGLLIGGVPFVPAMEYMKGAWRPSIVGHRGSIGEATVKAESVARHASSFAEVMAGDDLNVFDQPIEELALDVRELLITNGNVFFIGPDTETYNESAKEIAELLNYTYRPFMFNDFRASTDDVGLLEHLYVMPPLVSYQRWPWTFMMQGLVVWLDPDGNKKLNTLERDRLIKVKYPAKKAAFGPEKPNQYFMEDRESQAPGDPIDMYNEADVHVDLKGTSLEGTKKLILGSIINTILENPPKWRGWIREAKAKGTLEQHYETPLQTRRNFHSYGMSARLNRLLNA